MPEISRFYGIVIRMYFNNHAPPPFHALYGGAEAEVAVSPVALRSGRLPPRAIALVVEWALLHEQELMENWRRSHADEPAQKVAPLR